MKNKYGFTLIELLAVIVILAVIALITTPVILGVIDKAKKGALQDSAYGLIDSANLYYAEKMIENNNEKLNFTFSNGIQTSVNKLNYKGKVENGSLKLFKDGKSAVCIIEGKYAAIKNINDEKVLVKIGRCEYNEETNEYETKELCQDLQDEIDKLKRDHQAELDKLKKEYNEKILKLTEDQEKELERLMADYGAQIKTLTDAYELQIKTLTDQLNIFKTGGSATADKILAGQTAFVKGTLLAGTMTNVGAVNQTLNAGGSYTITAGYHNGSGKITVNNLASQTSGTATADKILTGQTAWVNGNKITGTMTNVGALNWNPSTSTSYTIVPGYYSGGTISTSNAYTAGYNAGVTASGAKTGTLKIESHHNYGIGTIKFVGRWNGTIIAESGNFHADPGNTSINSHTQTVTIR